MIILKVKDEETDEESLEMPEWMNNAHDIESDESEASADHSQDAFSSDSSDSSFEDYTKEQESALDEEDQVEVDVSSDNVASSLSDDEDYDVNGFDLFPAYDLPDNMDVSDDEETATARGCWYWYLYDKGYVSFPSHNNRDTNTDDKASATQSTSCNNENTKIPADSTSKISETSIIAKSSATADETKETTAEGSTASMAKTLDA